MRMKSAQTRLELAPDIAEIHLGVYNKDERDHRSSAKGQQNRDDDAMLNHILGDIFEIGVAIDRLGEMVPMPIMIVGTHWCMLRLSQSYRHKRSMCTYWTT
jgi:hypothetical protein